MDRTRFIEHRGRRILFIDFSEMNDPGEALAEIAKVRRVVAEQPPESLLTLTDVTGTRYDDDIIQALKELAAHNRPYVRAAASVTRTPLQLVALRASAIATRRRLEAFGDLEEAKNWLVQQGAAGVEIRREG
ncbi:MAG TPA: hypothetical protein VEW03_00645 [Longimicrobiaceae bacterium]|nr:hypothetical protein [Longimicrobiaceae bacterium]